MNNKTKEALRLLRLQKKKIQQKKCSLRGYTVRQTLDLIKIKDKIDEIKRDEQKEKEYRKTQDKIKYYLK